MKEKQKNRSAFQVMAGLIGMVKPLIGFMFIAITMGCIGNLMAIFITVLGGVALCTLLGLDSGISVSLIFVLLIIFAVLRGVLRYLEQACNHYIAFRLLARIRHQVFACLRKLAPSKLEGRDKGNLISIITSDIELLEVFYAHTISPIAIAIITSLIMCIFIGRYSMVLGWIALCFYIMVGAVIPIVNGRAGQKHGRVYRAQYGKLNTKVLDNLYGLDEILQYEQMTDRLKKMNDQTGQLEHQSKILKQKETVQRIITDSVILLAGIVVCLTGSYLVVRGEFSAMETLICTIAMMSSFGPTAALSALSNNLNQTLASGNRVLNLLEEEPMTKDVVAGVNMVQDSRNIQAEQVTFGYKIHENFIHEHIEKIESDKENHADSENVLHNFSATFSKNGIYGIHGQSGCGKSTLLKLLMRFFETDNGKITYSGLDVNQINTNSLRQNISYVTQETFLFEDTIEQNIKVANADATRQEVIEAAKKASIHDFITSLPQGYDTKLSELGESVSGGERQRIGLARAFLHNADIIFLDEPTSNIDSLNEAIILNSLKQVKNEKIIILVSHRQSTMSVADTVISM